MRVSIGPVDGAVEIVRDEAGRLGGGRDGAAQRVGRHRFSQEIRCAEVHRLDDEIDRGVSRHKYDDGARFPPPQLSKDLGPFHTWHLLIQEHDIPALAVPERLQAGRSVAGFFHAVPRRLERETHHRADVIFVVNDENLHMFISICGVVDCSTRADGKVKVNDDPRPGSDWTAICPPCA